MTILPMQFSTAAFATTSAVKAPKFPRFGQTDNTEEWIGWAKSGNSAVRGEGINKLASLNDVPQLAGALKKLDADKPETPELVFNRIRNPLIQSELLQTLVQNKREQSSVSLAYKLVEQGPLPEDTLQYLIQAPDKRASQLAIRALGSTATRFVAYGKRRESDKDVAVLEAAFQRLPKEGKIQAVAELFEAGRLKVISKVLQKEPGLIEATLVKLSQARTQLVEGHQAAIQSYESRIDNIHRSHSEDLSNNYSRKSDWEIWRDNDMTR